MRINPDNSFVHVMTAVFDVTIAYILYILCCLPVVTIGAATTALHATLLSVMDDSCSGVLKKFFGAFRENFRISSILWLLFAAAGIVVAADIMICFGFDMEQENAMLYAMRGITVFCVVFYTLMFHYTFAGVVKFQVTWKQALRNSLLFITKYPMRSLGIFLLSAAAAFSLYMGLIWALPAVIVLVCLQEMILRDVFRKSLGIKREKPARKDKAQYYE